jgi:putative NADH-flavin reductase
MKVLVLGATGGIGLELVRQAIERGHCVTAFVRTPERLKPFQDQITVIQCDVMNSAELERAVEGQDAALSGFGPRLPLSKVDADILRTFAVSVTTAMQHSDVRRVVIVSTAFLFKDAIVPPAYLFGRLFFPGIVSDASAMERVFQESALDWTMVRPAQLTDKARTGKYRIRESHLPLFGFNISRADVADCLIKTLDDRASVKKILGASN